MNKKVYDSDYKILKSIADDICEIVGLSKNERVSLAISGGGTGKALFSFLADNYKDNIAWGKIDFFWVDERCVSPESSESNYRDAKILLFDPLGIPDENIFRIRGEELDLQDELTRYSDIVKNRLENNSEKIPVFDVIILGMGEDGHTASIFPYNINLIDEKSIFVTSRHPVTGQNRITMTGGLILAAKNILLPVPGESKRELIHEILNDLDVSKIKYPIARIIDAGENLIVYYRI